MGRCYYRPSGCQPIALEMTSLDLNPQRCHSAPPSSISPLQGGLLLGSRASPWRSVPRSDWLFVFFLKMLSQTLKRKVPFYSLLSWHHQILLWLLVFAQYPCAQCFKHYVTQESRHDSLRVVVDPCLSVWPCVLRLQLTGHCPNHSAQLFAFFSPTLCPVATSLLGEAQKRVLPLPLTTRVTSAPSFVLCASFFIHKIEMLEVPVLHGQVGWAEPTQTKWDHLWSSSVDLFLSDNFVGEGFSVLCFSISRSLEFWVTTLAAPSTHNKSSGNSHSCAGLSDCI